MIMIVGQLSEFTEKLHNNVNNKWQCKLEELSNLRFISEGIINIRMHIIKGPVHPVAIWLVSEFEFL
jgi:hypothetical protein